MLDIRPEMVPTSTRNVSSSFNAPWKAERIVLYEMPDSDRSIAGQEGGASRGWDGAKGPTSLSKMP